MCDSTTAGAYFDPTSGTLLYCVDPVTSALTYPVGSTPDTQASTPTASSSSSGFLQTFGGVETDLLTAWRTITQPGLPPGQIGVSLAGGAAGATLSGSPILLIGLIAIVFLVTRKEL